MYGKIYGIYEAPNPKPPLHPFCRCVIEIMEALKAGTATDNKLDEAEKRCEYLSGFDGSILCSGSYAIVGTTVIRTSYLLTNEEQFELTDKITQALTKK